MRDSVPSTRYSSVCNVLRQWNIPLIPTYRVGNIHVHPPGKQCVVGSSPARAALFFSTELRLLRLVALLFFEA